MRVLHTYVVDQLEAENERLREAGQNLIDDVRKRYPNEELRCEFMIALDKALKGE